MEEKSMLLYTLVILITDLHLVLLVIGFEQVFLNNIDHPHDRPKKYFVNWGFIHFCACNTFQSKNQPLILSVVNNCLSVFKVQPDLNDQIQLLQVQLGCLILVPLKMRIYSYNYNHNNNSYNYNHKYIFVLFLGSMKRFYDWAEHLAVALTGYSCTSSGLATVFFQLHLQNLLHRWDYHYYLPWKKWMMMTMTMMVVMMMSCMIKSTMMMVMMTMKSKRLWSPDDGVKMVALTSIQYGPLVDNHIGF